MFISFTTGLLTGGSLIIAVGAQNAFLFEQAIKRHYGWLMASIFIISDALSMSLGAFGFGYLVQSQPWVLTVSKWAGVAFLLWYAYTKWQASRHDESIILSRSRQLAPLKTVLLMGLAVTWLNPHFYLDTMVLMGSLSLAWQNLQWSFIAGGICASIIWFFGLTLIGRSMTRWVGNIGFWRWFNRLNALIMIVIAFQIATI